MDVIYMQICCNFYKKIVILLRVNKRPTDKQQHIKRYQYECNFELDVLCK